MTEWDCGGILCQVVHSKREDAEKCFHSDEEILKSHNKEHTIYPNRKKFGDHHYIPDVKTASGALWEIRRIVKGDYLYLRSNWQKLLSISSLLHFNFSEQIEEYLDNIELNYIKDTSENKR